MFLEVTVAAFKIIRTKSIILSGHFVRNGHPKAREDISEEISV